MPFAARKPCAKHGCAKTVGRKDRWCTEHRQEYQRSSIRERRADPAKRQRLAFYSSVEWRECRAAYLADHPLCEKCITLELIVGATVVDHKIEIKAGGAPLDWSNLQGLCTPHHNSKTGKDQARLRQLVASTGPPGWQKV
jgi:5-methylcytosine-specific restriction protein A